MLDLSAFFEKGVNKLVIENGGGSLGRYFGAEELTGVAIEGAVKPWSKIFSAVRRIKG